MQKVLVYDMKSGNKYYAEDFCIEGHFVTLKNPAKLMKNNGKYVTFEKYGRHPRTLENWITVDYGITSKGLMLPVLNVTIEFIDKEPCWAHFTESDAKATLEKEIKQAKEKHDALKKAYLSEMNIFQKLLYMITEPSYDYC